MSGQFDDAEDDASTSIAFTKEKGTKKTVSVYRANS